MASYNRVILVGNVTRDLELRHIPSGTAVTDVGLAVNDRVKRNNEWVEEATFVDVTLWGRTAEIAAEYLSKGSSVLFEGRLKLDQWEKDGQKFSKLKVVGDRMQFLGGRGGSGGSSSQGGSNYNQGGSNQGGSNFGNSSQGDSFAPADNFAPAGGPPPSDEIPF